MLVRRSARWAGRLGRPEVSGGGDIVHCEDYRAAPPPVLGGADQALGHSDLVGFFYTLRAPLVVVRRGLGEAPRYRRRAPPNRRQTAAAHCKRAGGILKPPPLLGV